MLGIGSKPKSLKKSIVLWNRFGVIMKITPMRRKKKPAEIALKIPSLYLFGIPP